MRIERSSFDLMSDHGSHLDGKIGGREIFTGSPTDKPVSMLIGGIVAAAVGLFGTMRGSSK